MLHQKHNEGALYALEVKKYLREVKKHPQDTALYVKLGDAYRLLKEQDKAMEWLQAALLLNPSSAEAYRCMAEVYLLYPLWDSSKALTCWEKALELEPERLEWYLKLAAVDFHRCDYDCDTDQWEVPLKGIDYLEKALTLEPSAVAPFRAEICYHLATGYVMAQDFERAMHFFRVSEASWGMRAPGSTPHIGMLYYAMANCYISMGQVEEATDVQRKILDSPDTNWESKERAYRCIGGSYAMIKAYDLARKYYLQAIEVNEKSDRPHLILLREAYKTMADSYFQENRFKESQEWLQKALDTLREGENGLDVRFALARTYEGLERFEDAIAVYQALLEMSPNNELYLHFLGSAWNKVGEHDKAIDCLQQAIALSPDNPAICQTLGIIYHNLEQYDKAVHLLQKAITLEPENTDRSNGYLCLGAMYLESTSVERRRTAIQYLHKAVDMGNERAEELLRRIQVIIH